MITKQEMQHTTGWLCQKLILFNLKVCMFSHTRRPDFNLCFQIRLYPRRVHSDHRVHLTDGHSGGDPEKVPQPHLLHPVLPKLLHHLALGGHGCSLCGHSAVHGGVEQRVGGSAWTRHQGEEGGVKTNTKMADLLDLWFSDNLYC